jgi:tripartite-type tricarboxylate transporter receptor subunit TctC
MSKRTLLLLALALAPAALMAQSYPVKPVTIISPYGAGGNADLAARATSRRR